MYSAGVTFKIVFSSCVVPYYFLSSLTNWSKAESLDFNMFWRCYFRDIFPSHVRLYVQNDAVAALASGTMGKLHGCVLIAGTGTIAYGFTEDGTEARAAGAGPVLGDWGR